MKYFPNVTDILASPSSKLKELATAAGVNSNLFYVDASFRGVDVRGEDLSGINLSSADFTGVIADSGTTVDKKYRKKLFQAAVSTVDLGQDLIGAIRKRDPDDLVNAIVMLARAGDPTAERLLDAFNENVSPPKYSSALMVCDELMPEGRQIYYSKWMQLYHRDPSAAIVFAVVCYEFETLPTVLQDSAEYVEKFGGTEYSKYNIDRVVTSIIGTEQKQYMNYVESWCEDNILHDRMSELFDFYVVFEKMRTDRMGEMFALWLDSRSKNRRIASLVRRSVGYFSMPIVEQAAARWTARNLRAAGVEALLIALMRGVLFVPELPSIILRWRKLNYPQDPGKFGREIERYLHREAPNRRVSTRTKRILLQQAAEYSVAQTSE